MRAAPTSLHPCRTASGLLLLLAGRTATASLRLTVNRAPYGGDLQVAYTAPLRALASDVSLAAVGWVDDGDLPLTYGFTWRALGSAATLAEPIGDGSLAT